MGVRHRGLAGAGQRHSRVCSSTRKSILTEHGHAMRNFLKDAAALTAAAVIDLRSGTVTRPMPGDARGDGARRSQRQHVGDDPSVNALQASPGLLGKQAALFVPSGTQGSSCALMSHCQRGDNTWSARWPTPTAGRPAAARCSAASSRSRSPTRPTAHQRLAEHPRLEREAGRPALARTCG